MPEPSQLPDSLREFAYRNAVQIDSGRDFEHHMNGLIRATDAILLRPAPGQADVAPTLAAAAAVDVVKADPPAPPSAQVATPASNLFLPTVGGGMTVIGLMHLGWFTSNLLAALSAGAVSRMFQDVWTFADMSFGFGGLVVGIAVICGAQWARSAGIVLCALIAASNLLWFTDSFDKGLPRLMLLGTGVTAVLAVLGGYLLLFRWPAQSAQK